MKRFFIKMSLLLCPLFLLNTLAFGQDLSRADEAFKNRGKEPVFENIAKARQLYKEQLQKLSGNQLKKAVIRLARLDYYEGILLPENASERLIAIFTDCLQDVERIASTNSLEYHYWKGGCLAGWIYGDGGVEALKKTKTAVNELKEAMSLDCEYEGGGAHRISGAIIGDPRLPTINPFGGPIRDHQKAVEYLTMALRSDASNTLEEDYKKDTSTGDYFYSAYYFLARSLSYLGKKTDAIKTLDEAIGRIEDGDIPAGREPETKAELKRLKDLKASL